MKRYYGNQAVGYLRQKQVEAQKKLADSQWRSELLAEVRKYASNLQGKSEPKTSTEDGGNE